MLSLPRRNQILLQQLNCQSDPAPQLCYNSSPSAPQEVPLIFNILSFKMSNEVKFIIAIGKKNSAIDLAKSVLSELFHKELWVHPAGRIFGSLPDGKTFFRELRRQM